MKELRFVCPWNGKCEKTSADESELFLHLREHLSGPFVHYFLKSSIVTIQLPERGLVYLEDFACKNIFFVQRDENNEFWLSLLGDELKAQGYEFKILSDIEPKSMTVNSLVTSRKNILDNGFYVSLPLGVKEVTIEIIKRNSVER